MTKITMVVDLDRCIGCFSCEIACKQENDVALGSYWNRVDQMGSYGEFPHVKTYWLPHGCQHCANPACVEACPTGASSQREEDGLVLVDPDACIGCESCVKACPYHARSIDYRTQFAGKCTLCSHLREKGESPACVKMCPGAARLVGDIDDQSSDVAHAIADAGAGNVHYLPNAGGNPSVAYILHSKTCEWHDPEL